MWRVLPLTWTLNLFQDSKIRFNFELNLTSAISNFSESQHLVSYVSCHNAMAYDNLSPRPIFVPVTSCLHQRCIKDAVDIAAAPLPCLLHRYNANVADPIGAQ
jgi:hypothetical protein